jgi:hypothetical protein
MKTKTLLASLALAGLVIAQPASATSRSIDSQAAAERIGSPTGESENLRGRPLLFIVLVFLAVGGLVLLLSDGEDPVSP